MQRELRDAFSGPLESTRLGAAALPASPRPQLPGLVHDGGGPLRRRTGSYRAGAGDRHARGRTLPRAAGPARTGRNLLKLGRYRDAADCLQVAVNLIDQYGYDPALPHVVGLLASALARTGEAAKAVGSVEAWLARGLQDRTGRLELYYLNAGYAEALAQLGSSPDALAAINRALDVARSISNPCRSCRGSACAPAYLRRSTYLQIAADLAEQASLCRQYGLVADEQLRASSASPAGR